MSFPTRELDPGVVVWVALEPVRGREQGGHRPAVVVSGAGHLDAATTLAMVLPATTVDRSWPNHVRLVGDTGLPQSSWAMCEQVRTVSRSRITEVCGRVAPECLAELRAWLAAFLDLEVR